MSETKAKGTHGGARQGAGDVPHLVVKKMYSMRLADLTVERVERFAKSRKLDRTAALEQMIQEYAAVLDGIILPGRWHPETHMRPGLKGLRSMYPKTGRKFADELI